MTNRLFYKYPSRKNPLGNRQTVSAATTDMMRLIQGRYYVPNNSALVITGDVAPEEVFNMAQEFYGDWPKRAKDPFVEFPLVEHPPLAEERGRDRQAARAECHHRHRLARPSIGKDNPATYAADVFSFILTQPNSRFQRALVDTGLVDRRDHRLSDAAQRRPDPDHRADAARQSARRDQAPSTTRSRTLTTRTTSRTSSWRAPRRCSKPTTSTRARSCRDYAHTLSASGGPRPGLDYFRGYLGNLRRTSRADISRYITTYIQGKPHVGLVADFRRGAAANSVETGGVDRAMRRTVVSGQWSASQ